MAFVPAKVATRLAASLKRFQPILEDLRKRDVNESDTVTLVTDILGDVFGYDKYGQITSEVAIRGTYCDLAIKLEGHVAMLIEVKAIGMELKESHTKQAVDYAANQGCEWVTLTNGVTWQVYQVAFAKPIEANLIIQLSLPELNHRKAEDIEQLALLCRESWPKSSLEDAAIQRMALSRFTIAAVILGEPVLQAVRREIRRISSDVKVELDDISKVLTQEVIKREVIDGDKAEAARKLVAKAARRALRTTDKAVAPTASQPDAS